MDATFLAKIKTDFPSLNFVSGKKFAFKPPRTVVFSSLDESEDSVLLLLHEIGHYLTGRYDFKTEIERLKIEVLAWEKARELCAKYNVEINEGLIQNELDTYRDWLHQKSRCPSCGLTRFQTSDGKFHCPRCDV